MYCFVNGKIFYHDSPWRMYGSRFSLLLFQSIMLSLSRRALLYLGRSRTLYTIAQLHNSPHHHRVWMCNMNLQYTLMEDFFSLPDDAPTLCSSVGYSVRKSMLHSILVQRLYEGVIWYPSFTKVHEIVFWMCPPPLSSSQLNCTLNRTQRKWTFLWVTLCVCYSGGFRWNFDNVFSLFCNRAVHLQRAVVKLVFFRLFFPCCVCVHYPQHCIHLMNSS